MSGGLTYAEYVESRQLLFEVNRIKTIYDPEYEDVREAYRTLGIFKQDMSSVFEGTMKLYKESPKTLEKERAIMYLLSTDRESAYLPYLRRLLGSLCGDKKTVEEDGFGSMPSLPTRE